MVEFGKADEREKTQFRIILGGWNGKTSRIAAHDPKLPKEERDYDKETVNHTLDEWENTRLEISKSRHYMHENTVIWKSYPHETNTLVLC